LKTNRKYAISDLKTILRPILATKGLQTT